MAFLGFLLFFVLLSAYFDFVDEDIKTHSYDETICKLIPFKYIKFLTLLFICSGIILFILSVIFVLLNVELEVRDFLFSSSVLSFGVGIIIFLGVILMPLFISTLKYLFIVFFTIPMLIPMLIIKFLFSSLFEVTFEVLGVKQKKQKHKKLRKTYAKK